MKISGKQVLRCSFCGLGRKDRVSRLLEGPGANVCGECMVELHEIFMDLNQVSAIPFPVKVKQFSPSLDEHSDKELLVFLARVEAVRKQADERLVRLVGQIRDRGVSWGRIGDALGITRQSAWGRFSDEP
jgi:hypothetical protein